MEVNEPARSHEGLTTWDIISSPEWAALEETWARDRAELVREANKFRWSDFVRAWAPGVLFIVFYVSIPTSIVLAFWLVEMAHLEAAVPIVLVAVLAFIIGRYGLEMTWP